VYAENFEYQLQVLTCFLHPSDSVRLACRLFLSPHTSAVRLQARTYFTLQQFCGSGRLLSGSGSDFSNGLVPVPVPETSLYKMCTKFSQPEIFGPKGALTLF
jgi:hypothetical protein